MRDRPFGHFEPPENHQIRKIAGRPLEKRNAMGNAPLREAPLRTTSGIMGRTAIPRRQPPFHPWPTQYFDPRYGFAWYVEPAILVKQSIEQHGSLAVIELFNDLVDEVLELRADSIRAAG